MGMKHKYTRLKSNPLSNPGLSHGSSAQAARAREITGKLSGTRKASSFAEEGFRAPPTRSAPKGGKGYDPVNNKEDNKDDGPLHAL
jgi:hypothetical protein